jgi:hypothetical protein
MSITSYGTVPAKAFADAVHNASLFTSGDPTRLVLTLVHVTFDGEGLVTLRATDSYTLIRCAVGPTFVGGDKRPAPTAAYMDPVRAKKIVAGAKKDGLTRLEVEGGWLVIDGISTGNADINPQITFPEVDKFFDDTALAPTKAVGFNPKYLARLGQVRTLDKDPVKLEFGGDTKPTRFTFRGMNRITGVIMPVRIFDTV